MLLTLFYRWARRLKGVFHLTAGARRLSPALAAYQRLTLASGNDRRIEAALVSVVPTLQLGLSHGRAAELSVGVTHV